MKYIQDYRTFEGINGRNDYVEGDVVVIRYEITDGDPVLTPVKIIKRFTPNKFLVSHNVEDSNFKNFPNLTIKHSMIISLFKELDKPNDSLSVTQNPKYAPNVSSMIPGGNGHAVNDIGQLPANQSPSNDIAI